MNWKKWIGMTLSYILVAVLASAITLAIWGPGGQRSSKLAELQQVISRYFVGDADMAAAEDAAAAAMVDALGDRWSYYIPADEYGAYQDYKDNSYVGIGVTVTQTESGAGIDVVSVTAGGPAEAAGLLAGDVIVKVGGQVVVGMTVDQVKELIRGEAGTPVTISVMRSGAEQTFTVKRQKIQEIVATGKMLDGNIGLIRINNFNSNCSKETIAAIKSLREQGATKLIFDVRSNPGGYVAEMLEVLDYLLPEGVLFRQEDYSGKQKVEKSDAACLQIPMAVLVNGNSYSAAEFFAAALREYDWATIVGEKTCGKGYYQNSFELSDGSAVNLSTGKYCTPNGVNLTEAGGLTPDVQVALDANSTEDAQLQAAIAALTGK